MPSRSMASRSTKGTETATAVSTNGCDRSPRYLSSMLPPREKPTAASALPRGPFARYANAAARSSLAPEW